MTAPAQAAFIAELFAPHRVQAHSATATSEHIAALFPDEARHIPPMIGSRRAEYATGRACARAAIANLHVGDDQAIRRDERGAPVWPSGVTGSISHTEGFCAAVAARTSNELASVGIDIERIDRVGERVRRRILTESEAATVETMTADRAQWHTAVAFAAKEAFYKAQYQLTATYLGFGAVEVDLHGTALAFRSDHDAVESLVDRAAGRIVEHDGRVVAAVVVSATRTTPVPSEP